MKTTTNIVVKLPSECSKSELASFEVLLKRGGEVANGGLAHRIKRAKWLVFLFDKGGTLAGIAALKKPSVNYKTAVFQKARSNDDPVDFAFEAGWIYVKDEFRGRKYSQLLLEKVLALAGKAHVYATTRQNNEVMKRTNCRYGLKQSGLPYASDEGNYNLVLYTKRHSK